MKELKPTPLANLALFSGAVFLMLSVTDIATAQTVQLPTFNSISYSGSVMVPTGGTTSLGGVSRSSSTTRRSFGQRSNVSGFGHSGLSVRATIIDHDEIDRQIRGLPPRSAYGSSSRSGKAFGQSNPVGQGHMVGQGHGIRQSTGSGAGLSRQASGVTNGVPVQLTKSSDTDEEGKALVRFARKQYLAGKKSSAFEAYQLAIQTLSPELSELAKKEFQRVFPKTLTRSPGSEPANAAPVKPLGR